jgi:hypothetical protein
MNDSWSPDEEEQLKKAFEELDKIREEHWKKSFPHIPYKRPIYYTLDANKNPVPCSSFEFEKDCRDFENRKRVAKTTIGPYTVSTVFLSIDHNFGKGQPILFETMIWSDKDINNPGAFFDVQYRYRTWEEAMEGHRRIVAEVEAGKLP